MRMKLLALSLAVTAATAVGGGIAVAAGDGGGDTISTARAPHAGPPAMSHGYEVWRSDVTQSKVDVTSVGRLREGTHVLTLHLDEGAYLVWAFVTAGKNSGDGVLRCGVLVPEGAVTFARASLGDQTGTSRAATLTSHGAYAVSDGGTDLELKCTQEAGAVGATPQVFDAVIDALEIGTFSSTQGS
jgi:hypothetical protein